MTPVVAIVGPTAVGKSALALSLARRFDGEIVCADSRQVCRYMDIGTAKPTPEECALVPHHLIDIVDPDQEFSLALYQDLAYRALEGIRRRGKMAFLVGGSGLYVWAVLEGWSIPHIPPSPRIRQELEERATAEGIGALYRDLQEVDPESARLIHPHNLRRIIRALEVCRATGGLFSSLRQKSPPDFDILILGLTAPRGELYRRIDWRVDDMIRRGLVSEVECLLARGYAPALPSMSGVGYREISAFLEGELSLATAIQKIKNRTHRFARHQYAWFRLADERVRWLDADQDVENAALALLSQSPGLWLHPQ